MSTANGRDKYVRIHFGESGPRHKITCTSCGEEGVIPGSKLIPEEACMTMFRTRGWDIAKNGKKRICPECCASQREARKITAQAEKALTEIKTEANAAATGKQQKEAITMTDKTANTKFASNMKADAPREMGRDDRRIIFEKLNDTYVSEKVGYDKGWSDKRLSEDLGVPRAWVVQVRDEMFGPSHEDEAAGDMLKRIEAISAEIVTVKTEAAGLSEKLKKLFQNHNDLLAEARDLKRVIA